LPVIYEGKRQFFPLSQIQAPDHFRWSNQKTPQSLERVLATVERFLVEYCRPSKKTGRRRSCLTKKATKSGHTSKIACMCHEQEVCKFIASADELVIEQLYTYPIASRSLDTGVVDKSKTSNCNQAGGFGDGFKRQLM
jgi:hypothetical protein